MHARRTLIGTARRRGSAALAALAVLALVAAACGDAGEPAEVAPTAEVAQPAVTPPMTVGDTYYSMVIEEERIAADIALTDHSGAPFRLSDYADGPVLITFGYTHCPDVCPLTLANWSRAAERMGVAAEDYSYIFVTVDPQRDTVEYLATYLESFDLPVVGLTGDSAAMADVWSDYGVYVEQGEVDANGGYAMAHTSATWVIDPAGRVRLAFPHIFSDEKIAHDLTLLSEEGRSEGGT